MQLQFPGLNAVVPTSYHRHDGVPLLVGHAEQVTAAPPRNGQALQSAGFVLVKPEGQGGRHHVSNYQPQS